MPEPKTQPFKKGNSVKVKAGVMCPDHKELCIGGWQGRIDEVHEETVDIHWDSPTLKAMPAEFVTHSEEHGLSFAVMGLNHAEVEPAEPRDSAKEAEDLAVEMENRCYWLGEGKEGRRIHAVVGLMDPDDEIAMFEAWRAHLKKALSFPFDAEVSEFQEGGAVRQGDKVSVRELLPEVDEVWGVFVKVRRGGRDFEFPLCELKAIGKKTPNYDPVSDYAVWYANK
ncbi:MAG: hypothetical protein JW990_07940 [Thermoleophilia bacterium]|nr:hypothetical protein [Thermoleophilia bacterium]